MNMPDGCQLVTGTIIEEHVDSDLSIIEFSSAEDEDAYGERDGILCDQIRACLAKSIADEESYFVIDDWWPNQLKGVEIRQDAVFPKIALALKELLVDSYENYRIVLRVYNDWDKTPAIENYTILVTSEGCYFSKL